MRLEQVELGELLATEFALEEGLVGVLGEVFLVPGVGREALVAVGAVVPLDPSVQVHVDFEARFGDEDLEADGANQGGVTRLLLLPSLQTPQIGQVNMDI